MHHVAGFARCDTTHGRIPTAVFPGAEEAGPQVPKGTALESCGYSPPSFISSHVPRAVSAGFLGSLRQLKLWLQFDLAFSVWVLKVSLCKTSEVMRLTAFLFMTLKKKRVFPEHKKTSMNMLEKAGSGCAWPWM